MPTDPVKVYLKHIEKAVWAGDGTEHTYRPALKSLIEAVAPGVTAINEPRRCACGAPDFEVKGEGKHPRLTIGHIEAKDVDADLGRIESDSNRKSPRTHDGEQLSRYRNALPNLLLTSYLEFRWYVRGEHRLMARLATIATGGKLRPVPGGDKEVLDLLRGRAARRLAIPHRRLSGLPEMAQGQEGAHALLR